MTEFVTLAAGLGTRMREATDEPKPLVEVADRPLLGHVLDRAAAVDPSGATVVVGYRHELVQAYLEEARDRYDFPIETAVNPAPARENGYSLLQAERVVDGPFVLAMSDHVVEPELYRRAAAHDGLGLCVDDSPPPGEGVDEATKVRIEDGSIAAIGKDLDDWDAVDTGVFSMTPAVFDALQARTDREEVTVTHGVRELLRRGRDVEPVDVSGCTWVDVDTPADLEITEELVADGPRP